MPYPDGITVDGEQADAILEYGILKVKQKLPTPKQSSNPSSDPKKK